MEIKFTPWRMAYIQGTDSQKEKGCVLCHLHEADPTQDADHLVLYRGEYCYVVLNLYPYNNGHLMVVPYVHTADLAALDGPIAQELFVLTQRAVDILGKTYHAHGFNIGMNLGRVAGAGIDEHLHMHVLPRWSGDTNFMPLVGDTKLVPEDLNHTYARLKPCFDDASCAAVRADSCV